MNKYSFILFLIMVSAIYYGMNYYVYHRIATGLALSPQARHLLAALFITGGLLFFAGEMVSRQHLSLTARIIYMTGATWLGVIALGITVFALRDLVTLIIRGKAFMYWSTLCAVALLACSSIYALYNGARPPLVKEVRVPLANLPAELEGFSIVHLSDIHIHLLTSPFWLDQMVETANALQPDLTVVTGDLIDANLCRLDSFCRILGKLRSPNGVYVITGNHEYYSGLGIFMKIAEESGMIPLRNRKVMIGSSLELAGIDDREIASPRPALREVFGDSEAAPGTVRVLLAHRPDVFADAVRSGVSLQLSGHTHAGQLPPLTFLVRIPFKYYFGLHKLGSSYIYTTSGTGTWGPPMRLFTRSEIVKLILTKEHS